MTKRREGPNRNKQTNYYFFDEYVGIGQDKKRIRFSLKTKILTKPNDINSRYLLLWAEWFFQDFISLKSLKFT